MRSDLDVSHSMDMELVHCNVSLQVFIERQGISIIVIIVLRLSLSIQSVLLLFIGADIPRVPAFAHCFYLRDGQCHHPYIVFWVVLIRWNDSELGMF